MVNRTYVVYERYFWQGNHQIYGAYIRCICTVLANPKLTYGMVLFRLHREMALEI